MKYFSQDAVIKLAPRAGITLDESLSPAEKLKAVQTLMEEGSGAAARVYESIGVYLGHTLALYYRSVRLQARSPAWPGHERERRGPDPLRCPKGPGG